jgi:hypothetical protein
MHSFCYFYCPGNIPAGLNAMAELKALTKKEWGYFLKGKIQPHDDQQLR